MQNILKEQNSNNRRLMLSDRKWKSFRVDDIFHISGGRALSRRDMIDGNTPFVSALKHSNGVSSFISNNIELQRDFLGINFNGEGGVVYNFYHPYSAGVSGDVKILTLKQNMKRNSKYIYLFIGESLFKQRSKYSFGYKLSAGRLKGQKIMLPINEEHNPDYEFMIDYMMQLESDIDTSMLKSAIKITQNTDKKDENKFIENNVGNMSWKEFWLVEVFSEIRPAVQDIDFNSIEENKKKNGIVPYISRTNKNNGIANYIQELDDIQKEEGNCISIGLDTQTVFYQPMSFYSGQNIQILCDTNLNKYTAIFLLPLLENMLDKFNWGGNGATLTRLKRSKLMLPEKNGKPDWMGMEKYIKSLRFNELI